MEMPVVLNRIYTAAIGYRILLLAMPEDTMGIKMETGTEIIRGPQIRTAGKTVLIQIRVTAVIIGKMLSKTVLIREVLKIREKRKKEKEKR